MNVLRAIGPMAVMAFLGACAVSPQSSSIRPGLGSDADLDSIRPPSGVTYKFDLLNDEVPVPVSMDLTSRRRSATDYRYRGQLAMTLPDAQNLEQVARILTEALGQTDVTVRGNQLFIPVGLRADNRFRSKSSNITGDTTTYAPHDFFAVLGTCRYTATDRNGRSAALITETTEENGIWRSRTVLDPDADNRGLLNETRRAVYSIDKNAVLIDMIVFRGSGAGRSSFSIRRK